jgi:uncharacterized protein YoxC
VLLVAVIVAIALASFGILLVLVIGLIRHVKLLGESLGRMQKEMQPMLEEIRRGSSETQDRIDKLAQRRDEQAGSRRSR